MDGGLGPQDKLPPYSFGKITYIFFAARSYFKDLHISTRIITNVDGEGGKKRRWYTVQYTQQ